LLFLVLIVGFAWIRVSRSLGEGIEENAGRAAASTQMRQILRHRRLRPSLVCGARSHVPRAAFRFIRWLPHIADHLEDLRWDDHRQRFSPFPVTLFDPFPSYFPRSIEDADDKLAPSRAHPPMEPLTVKPPDEVDLKHDIGDRDDPAATSLSTHTTVEIDRSP
jgi:hypothetical protein